ncbi:hypothetical protein Aple_037750 [Acrocarpospora pleiomorpha]|uniref:Uncharacterized protein n=1 Tax=Acrocarpospora pleiomorpha TaxID=90975 RepID=A0A5M3XL38_9ACTN|nr:hypothetical protein [Acrocarpospora pleiomorpha]GES20879.1 hypothetical protein Aple_037750 [Acrocarpospora pleiomorpha]
MTNHEISAQWLPHPAAPNGALSIPDTPGIPDAPNAADTSKAADIPYEPDVADASDAPGSFDFPARAFTCACGLALPDETSAELHAMELNLCTACFGTTRQEPIPGYTRPCTACAATGRRGPQLVWELAHAEAERVITLPLIRALLPHRPFRLSELSDQVRTHLGLPPGRLPVGPRVRDLLLHLQSQGELALLSAPARLLQGTDVVLYDDPHWVRTA